MSATVILGGSLVWDPPTALAHMTMHWLAAHPQRPAGITKALDPSSLEKADRYLWWKLSELSVEDWVQVKTLLQKLALELPSAMNAMRINPDALDPYRVGLTEFQEIVAARIHGMGGERT